MKLCSLVLLINIALSQTQSDKIKVGTKHIYCLGKSIASDVAKAAATLVPEPKEILDAGIQTFAAYPFEGISTVINKICSAALTAKPERKATQDAGDMNFLLYMEEEIFEFPLIDPDHLWKNPSFDKNKNLTILVTGWLSNRNETNDALETIADAYLCRGDTNFVAIDTSEFLDTFYTWSAYNSDYIGSQLAFALMKLQEYIPIERIHLIGHSLGAHVVGAAARMFNFETGKLIPRITGLDPAKPCFNEGHLLTGLNRGDAEFIDVIHSNPGVLGKRDPMGDVDFYPGGLDPLPPGCLDIVCAHSRAWKYYAESVYPGNENNFMAVRCNSLKRLKDDLCKGSAIPMGLFAPRNAKGNYFLDINSNSPYGIQSGPNALSPQCNE